jgi:hypothetical protein
MDNTDSQDSPRSRLGGSHHLPPYIIYYVPLHGGHIQMAFHPGTPMTLEVHNFACRPSIVMRSQAKL